jgi:hypothetical protein
LHTFFYGISFNGFNNLESLKEILYNGTDNFDIIKEIERKRIGDEDFDTSGRTDTAYDLSPSG